MKHYAFALIASAIIVALTLLIVVPKTKAQGSLRVYRVEHLTARNAGMLSVDLDQKLNAYFDEGWLFQNLVRVGESQDGSEFLVILVKGN